MRALLQADGITPAVGAGIGTAASPVTVTAANMTVNGVNSPVFVTGTGTTNFIATASGRTVPGNLLTQVPGATLNLSTTAGLLIIGGASQTDGGAIALTSNGTGGGIVVNAALGDSDSGSATLDAGPNAITFNANYTVNAGNTTTFNAGTPVTLGISTTNNGTLASTVGINVGSGDTLTGTGSVTGPLNVLANGVFSPAGSLTTIANTGNLTASPGGVLALNLNSALSGPGAGYDQINAAGDVSIDGASLRLLVGSVNLGDTFTIVSNGGSNPVTGQFAGGTTIRGFNNPLVTFSLDYAGGDGNDIVATVSNISTASALLDVQGNQAIYFSNVGIANSVAVTQAGSNFQIVESAPGAAISLSQAAKDAGWTGDGTNTVSGPKASIAGLNFGLSDGADTITGINAGTASISVNGTGTLTVTGTLSTSSTFSMDEFTALTLNGSINAGTGVAFTGLNALAFSGTGTLSTASGNITSIRFGDLSIAGPTLSAAGGSISLTGSSTTNTTLGDFTTSTPTLNITGSSTVTVNGVVTDSGAVNVNSPTISAGAGSLLNATTLTLSGTSIGASGSPIFTKATTIVTNSNSGTYISEADGATVTATATGAGEVNIANSLGLLTLAGATTTGSGPINIGSQDGVELDGTLGASNYSGKITINANMDGAGSEGFTHTVGATITTTNISSDAFTINVNTPTGGTGNAVLGVTSVGGNTGGTIAVNSNEGSILWNPGYGTVSGGTLSNPVGGSSLQGTSLRARDYVLTTSTDGGGIGTLDTPLQTANFGTDGTAKASNATLTAGLGGIFLTDWSTVDLTIANATAAGGDIQLFSGNESGHNLFATGTVFTGNGNIWLAADDDLHIEGATIGGSTFGGTIKLEANRDGGNEQRILMDGLTTVQTTNTSATAVQMFVYATDNDATNATLGGITVGNVIVGSGGTVTLNAAATATSQGNIRQIVGTRVDTGEGTVVIIARNLLNGVVPAVGAAVGFDLDGTGAEHRPHAGESESRQHHGGQHARRCCRGGRLLLHGRQWPRSQRHRNRCRQNPHSDHGRPDHRDWCDQHRFLRSDSERERPHRRHHGQRSAWRQQQRQHHARRRVQRDCVQCGFHGSAQSYCNFHRGRRDHAWPHHDLAGRSDHLRRQRRQRRHWQHVGRHRH